MTTITKKDLQRPTISLAYKKPLKKSQEVEILRKFLAAAEELDNCAPRTKLLNHTVSDGGLYQQWDFKTFKESPNFSQVVYHSQKYRNGQISGTCRFDDELRLQGITCKRTGERFTLERAYQYNSSTLVVQFTLDEKPFSVNFG